MEKIQISAFKAKCLAIVEKVKNTKEPIIITKKGKPIAQVIPMPEPEKEKDWLGCMKGEFTITGDIVGPISNAEDWEALNE